jgi:electron transport complex protein RnfA
MGFLFLKLITMELATIMIGAIFVNNIVLLRFYGICPFLGVSNKISSAIGMAGAVLFVMSISSIVAFLINQYILVPLNLEYMTTISFILVIASLVQMVEIILKKISPSLYQALGIFLPLITTNCAVLWVALYVVQEQYNLLGTVVFAVSNSIGFGIALVLFAGLREHLSLANVPKGMQGVPAAMIAAGLLALAFMGFSGLV